MTQNDHSDVYIIPPNFVRDGTLFSGRAEARNVVEAAFLALIGIPFFLVSRISLLPSVSSSVLRLRFRSLPPSFFLFLRSRLQCFFCFFRIRRFRFKRY